MADTAVDCLVFGASGAIGRFLLPRIQARGWRALAISRHPSGTAGETVKWLRGDLQGDMPDLSAMPIDIVFSVGPLDAFANRLARGDWPELRRVVAVSSMSAVVKQASSDPLERELASRLHAAERTIEAWCLAHAVACVILRPTLIYGAGIDRSLSALERLARRWRVFPALPGATGLRQPVHADDVAAACIAAADLHASEPRHYAIGGGERLSFGAMLARVRRGMPVSTLPLWIPLGLARIGLHALRLLPRWRHLRPGLIDRLGSDLVVDNGPAERDLCWSPRDFHAGANGGFRD